MVMSDVTLRANTTPLTVEDRLLIKTLQSEKAGLLKKIITQFPATESKWHNFMLFALLRIHEYTAWLG